MGRTFTAGRPRDPGRDQAILAATRELLAERGYAGFSIEGVAAKAGTAKTTIYRRWQDKHDLLVAALNDHVPRYPEIAEADSLRGDLIAHASRLATLLNGFDGRLALGVTQARPDDAGIAEELERTTPSGARLPERVISRAVARGELPAPVDRGLFEEIVSSPLTLKMIRRQPIDDDYVAHVVDDIVLAAFRSSAGEA
ncbi:TetR/AcrR family transcriptional regulator [Saccharopolyspora dendranthemae]|uniref:TetR/AcrR family transcriptional regulator n=1 Tax=Saccharopolyspora dendranthemae TaxID=1181886 RepID=UPI00164654CD|nr:TetR/AcrR family transcriptional regulator [Saccharopolyspora dendranthemae]